MGKTSENRNLQQHESQLEANPKAKAKLQYAAPRLVEYGSLAKLTRGGVAGTTEGGSMSCL